MQPSMAHFLFLQLEAWLLWIWPLSPVSTLPYMFKNMLAINCNGHVTMGSMINEMINDTIVFNPQLSALEVASDLQPDQGGTPSWSFDAPEVGLRAFLHATAADPAIRRRFL
jgi:hypothetical protein